MGRGLGKTSVRDGVFFCRTHQSRVAPGGFMAMMLWATSWAVLMALWSDSGLLCSARSAPTPAMTYKDHFRAAAGLVAKMRIPAAIGELDQAIKLNPDFVEGFLHRAKNKARVGDFNVTSLLRWG